jgi:hypothetical protein
VKYALLIPLTLAVLASNSIAQSRIYRCGNTYTNSVAEAQAKGCKLMEGGNVTVVEGTRVQSGTTVRVATVAQSAAGPGQRVDADNQRARDADARLIMETELRKAESRLSELVKEYNNGEPEKLGPEHRNHQKYLDRVAELKAGIARTESDISGIKRELGRVSK